MPLRFNERGPAVNGTVLLAVLLAVSVVLFGGYTVEGEGGPLHTVQGAFSFAASPLRTAGAGIQSAQTAAQTTLEDLNADPGTLSELRNQNEQLRQMVSELEEYRQTAQRLEGIQKLSDSYAMQGVTARVNSMSTESWNRVMTIDKGSDDGLAAGMPVMGSTGLVGQVKSVSGTSAQVRLLQDANSGVAVIIQSNRAEGLLKGNIDGLLYLEDVDNDVEVKVGDAIITSGLGGGYLRGLMVGTVVRVESASGQSVRKIVVAPNDTVSALEEVYVVFGMSSEGALAQNAQQQTGDNAQQQTGDNAQQQTGDNASNAEGGANASSGEGANAPASEQAAEGQTDADANGQGSAEGEEYVDEYAE